MSKPSNSPSGISPDKLHSGVMKWFVLPLARVIVTIVFGVLGPIRVRGRENLPKEGGVLMIANHISFVDPLVTQYASPRPIYFLAKSGLFEMPAVGSTLRLWKTISITQGQPDPAALRLAIALLKAGYPVCVYPEGGLSDTGSLKEIHRGVALIIRSSGVPVICLGLRNTDRVLPFKQAIPRPAWRFVWARWGQPKVFTGRVSNEEATAWIAEQLRELSGTSHSSLG